MSDRNLQIPEYFQARQRQMLQEAEHERLVRLVRGERRPSIYRRFLTMMGGLMITLGTVLQRAAGGDSRAFPVGSITTASDC